MIQFFRIPRRLLSCVLLLWLLCSPTAWARSEYEVKAAYLFNFIKFVVWPNANVAAEDPIDICVFGEDPFQGLLDGLAKLKAQGRPIALRYPEDENAVHGCDVLFVSPSESKFMEKLLPLAKTEHILTISDIKDFARDGGMIGFVAVGNVIRFQINLAAARQSGIEISTKLLELAQDVIQ